MGKVKQMSGRYGRLVVIGPAECPAHLDYVKGGNVVWWECKCDCGKVVPVRGTCLRSGATQSCGCLFKERMLGSSRNRTHGMSDTPGYKSWESMISRCNNPENKKYSVYGGRGISVCDEWMESFANFYKDMGPRPSSRHSIDRIESDKGYTPENCRWATPKEQARNLKNNVKLTLNGETMLLVEWAERLGVDAQVLRNRRRMGWSDFDILTRPVQQRKRK